MATFRVYVSTDLGRPDSLQKPVKLAFTLVPSPNDPKTYTRSYEPVVRMLTAFRGSSVQECWFDWISNPGFATYETEPWETRDLCQMDYYTPREPVQPGQSIALVSSLDNRTTKWECAQSCTHHGPSAILAVNNTGSPQKVALGIDCPTFGPSLPIFRPMVAYHPFNRGDSIIAPSDLALQAYVMSDDFPWKWDGIVMRPEDRTRPLFTNPPRCSALPETSRWRLSQDWTGAVQLRNSDEPDLGYYSIPSLAKSMSEMNDQLAALLKSVNGTQDRLETVEKAVSHAREDFARGQQSIFEIQGQLSEIKVPGTCPAGDEPGSHTSLATTQETVARLDQRVPALEAKANTLAQSFGQTQGYLSEVQKFLQTTRHQLADLHSVIPAVEAKTETLAGSVRETGTKLLLLEDALGTTGDRLGVLDQRVTDVEARVDSLEQTRDSAALRLAEEPDTPIVFPGHPSGTSIPSLIGRSLDSQLHTRDLQLPELPRFPTVSENL